MTASNTIIIRQRSKRPVVDITSVEALKSA